MLERATLRAAQARAQSRAPLPTLFDIEKIADGVYAAIARGRAIINSNAVVFENANDLLIVDAHAAPSAVYALVAQIRREVTQKPVRYVVTTHLHGDHTQGLPAYRSVAPKADIVACAKTRDLLMEVGPSRLKAAVDAVPRSLDNLRQKLAAAATAQEKAYYTEMIAQTQAFQEEMRNVAVEFPNVTFADHMTIHDKAHDLHLAYRGRGHTAGDIVVFCPQKRAIASGDLLHSFFPTIGDGYPRDWPETLRSISELEFAHVIGGHGGAHHDKQRLGQLKYYFEELIEVAARAKKESVPLDRLQETVTPATLKSLGGGYGEFLAGEVKRLDFRAQLNTPAEVMARGVRDNLSSVYRNLDRV
jgi:glyoxylase-like metal-dependent hydrolase (beta-lactamase superfamily II)